MSNISKITVGETTYDLKDPNAMTYADNGVLGAKNLLENKATSVGIFTVNSDGSITANGTSTSALTLDIDSEIVVSKPVILSGCPSGGSGSRYQLVAKKGSDYFTDSGDGVELSVGTYRIYVFIAANYTVNQTFYPMLRLASDPDDTYVPYAMTNREITEELTVQESAVTDIVEGASVGSDYGNHLIKKGNIVQLSLRLTGVTAQQWETVICRIPEGYRPKYRTAFRDTNAGKYLYCMPGGAIQSGATGVTNTELIISATWITD